jgi:hypothetical protein
MSTVPDRRLWASVLLPRPKEQGTPIPGNLGEPCRQSAVLQAWVYYPCAVVELSYQPVLNKTAQTRLPLCESTSTGYMIDLCRARAKLRPGNEVRPFHARSCLLFALADGPHAIEIQ